MDVPLWATIDKQGRVVGVTLVATSGITDIDQAALSHLQNARFRPARRAGEDIAARIRVDVRVDVRAESGEFDVGPPAPVLGKTGSTGVAQGPDLDVAGKTTVPDNHHAPEASTSSQGPAAQGLEATAGRSRSAVDSHGDDMATAVQSTGTQQTTYGAEATVQFGASRRRATAASDMRMEVGMLSQVPRPHAAALMTLAPGVVLSNHSGQGHASGIYLRGFDAGEGKDLEVLIEGIAINEPSNAHAHGYADTGFVSPELVTELRVLQGPYDARQADFAAAGTAEYHLGAPSSGVFGKVGYGSFGRRRAMVGYAPDHRTRRTFAAFDFEDGQGFGPNRAYHNVRALGQVTAKVAGADVRLLSGAHSLGFDSAGVVREDAVGTSALGCGGRDDSRDIDCLHDPNQGGQASRHLLSIEIRRAFEQHTLRQQLTYMARSSRFRENFTGALIDARGDGVDQRTDMTTLAARGSLAGDLELLNSTQRYELGYDARFDHGDRHMHRLRRSDQAAYAKVLDDGLSLSRVGGYGTLEISALDWLTAQVGLRADGYSYNVTDRTRPAEDLSGARLTEQQIGAFGINVQPRASVTVGNATGPRAIVSFGIGSRSSDAAALSEGESAPFTRIWSGESGLAYDTPQGALNLSARAAAYFSHVDRDSQFDEVRARNVPIGATNRFGAYGHGRLRYRRFADLSLGLAWAEAYAPTDAQSLGLAEGKRLAFVPRFSVRGDGALRQTLQIAGQQVMLGEALGLQWVSPRPLPLNRFGPAQWTVDLSLSATVDVFTLTLAGTNLTDHQNHSADYHYVSNFDPGLPTSRRTLLFASAPPRQLFFSVTVATDDNSATGHGH